MKNEPAKGSFIGAPQAFNLYQCCEPIHKAYPESLGIFHVGSSLDTRNFRDVDVRLIMSDERFYQHFPQFARGGDCDALWSLTCSSISEWLAKRTDLQIDFQIQSQSLAKEYTGKRNAIFLVNGESL